MWAVFIGFQIAANLLGLVRFWRGCLVTRCGRSTLPSDFPFVRLTVRVLIIGGESAQDAVPLRRLAIAKHQAFSLACANCRIHTLGFRRALMRLSRAAGIRAIVFSSVIKTK